MKALGVLLLLGGGLWVRQGVLRAYQEKIRLGQELLAALQILERGVYVLRRPLGELAGECRAQGRFTAVFWAAIEEELTRGTPFQRIWQKELSLLPPPYGELLAPLGQTLPAGEDPALLHQVREDVYRAVGQARQESGERNKLVTALCLSASLLLTVVLL